MVIEVASIFALFYGAHPTISDTQAYQIDFNGSTILGRLFVGFMDSVTQSWYVFASIGLTKNVEIPAKVQYRKSL